MTGTCPETRFPDGTHCGEYGWHASDCPMSDGRPRSMFQDTSDEAWHEPAPDESPMMGPADQIIDDVILEYRQELLDGMNRYHGCDRRGGLPCRADVYRVDRVILPVVRKMLEDVWEDKSG